MHTYYKQILAKSKYIILWLLLFLSMLKKEYQIKQKSRMEKKQKVIIK